MKISKSSSLIGQYGFLSNIDHTAFIASSLPIPNTSSVFDLTNCLILSLVKDSEVSVSIPALALILSMDWLTFSASSGERSYLSLVGVSVVTSVVLVSFAFSS